MDTNTKRKIKHYASGIALLAVLTFVSLTSNTEFTRVRSWAASAFATAHDNSVEIEENQQKIADSEIRIRNLEILLKQQNDVLSDLKEHQTGAIGNRKQVPPKTYQKPPRDWVPLDQKKKKKKFWFFD